MQEFNLKLVDSIDNNVEEFVRGLLIGVAASGKTIPYSELGWLLGIDVRAGDYPRKILSTILGAVGSYEHDQGRPVITAVVVFKESDDEWGREVVGKGFYALLENLQKHPDPDPIVAHAVELGACHTHWKGKLQ